MVLYLRWIAESWFTTFCLSVCLSVCLLHSQSLFVCLSCQCDAGCLSLCVCLSVCVIVSVMLAVSHCLSVCLCDCQSLSLAHVLTPCILMFVLALVHTQIMVSCGMSKKSRQLINSSARYLCTMQ